MAILRLPQIKWGTTFVNTLEIGIFDNARAYSLPRGGSELVMAPSGTEDAWIVGTDQYLEGDVRWIPTTDTTSPFVATGWDGITGVRAFLEYARDKNIIRWIPDKTVPTIFWPVYLTDPMTEPPELETDGTRRFHLRIRAVDDNPFTGY